jgi:hypothetical protein
VTRAALAVKWTIKRAELWTTTTHTNTRQLPLTLNYTKDTGIKTNWKQKLHSKRANDNPQMEKAM